MASLDDLKKRIASENPKKIRNEIKKGIGSTSIQEIPNRRKAIYECVNDLRSGDIGIIAGKGHEKTQSYHGVNYLFSDRREILDSIHKKNKRLFDDQRLNIIQDKTKDLPKNLKINGVSINSKQLRQNDIFFCDQRKNS